VGRLMDLQIHLPPVVGNFRPEIGLVLGSGLGSFAESMEHEAEIPYGDVKGLPLSGVPGHAGRFLLGSFKGVRLMVAQGRVHLYEGRSASEVTAGVRAMASAGIKTLILTNAAGIVNPDGLSPGQWMMIADHLNLTGTTPLLGGANFVDLSHVYSPELRQRFAAAAESVGMLLPTGVYAGLHGPQYETPAEVRMLQKLGADAVGMSTVLEAIQARALGLETVGFSCLTNWGAGLSPEPLRHEDVLETGVVAASQFVDLLAAVLEQLALSGGEPPS
jgi:purine-nucleoside phosphorylase